MNNYNSAVYNACVKTLENNPRLLAMPFWDVYDALIDAEGVCYVSERTAKRCVTHHMDEVRHHFRMTYGEMGTVYKTMKEDLINVYYEYVWLLGR